jgi:hypothetical protein
MAEREACPDGFPIHSPKLTSSILVGFALGHYHPGAPRHPSVPRRPKNRRGVFFSATTQKAPIPVPESGLFAERTGRLFLVAVALVELVNPAGGVEQYVFARVERVRLRRNFHLHDGVRFSFKFYGFARLDRRAGQKLVVARQIPEHDFFVLGMNAAFHIAVYQLVGFRFNRAAKIDNPLQPPNLSFD